MAFPFVRDLPRLEEQQKKGYECFHIVTTSLEPNARINRARNQRIKHGVLRMKATPFALRFNEMLGFARRNHSASPYPSTSLQSFSAPAAVRRFTPPKHHLPVPARGADHSGDIRTQH
jgi:hypothetical protein